MTKKAEIARSVLSGKTVAVSVSVSPDLGALGFLEDEDDRFLEAVLTPLVYADARVAYGGRIERRAEKNFTREISTQLAEAYRRWDTAPGKRPMIHYLRASDAQKHGVANLFRHARRLGSYSEIRLLSGQTILGTLLPRGNGVRVNVGKAEPFEATSASQLAKIPVIARFLSGKASRGDLADMRHIMAKETDARIIVGGRISGMVGGTSGVAEEAASAIKAEQPLLIVGAVGGASRDVAYVLGLLPDSERILRDEASYRDSDGKPSCKRYWDHMHECVKRQRKIFEANAAKKGVLPDLKRLAISESHSEVSALVLAILTRWLA